MAQGAAIGSAGGAIIGGVTSGTVGGAVVGGVAGAAVGAVVADVTRPRYAGQRCYYSQPAMVGASAAIAEIRQPRQNHGSLRTRTNERALLSAAPLFFAMCDPGLTALTPLALNLSGCAGAGLGGARVQSQGQVQAQARGRRRSFRCVEQQGQPARQARRALCACRSLRSGRLQQARRGQQARSAQQPPLVPEDRAHPLAGGPGRPLRRRDRAPVQKQER